MWYHVIAHYGANKHYWWNRSRDDVVRNILVPLLNKQVTRVSRKGVSSLFNFSAVSYVTIVKSTTKFTPPKGKAPPELTKEEFVKKNEATREFVDDVQLISSKAAARSIIERALIPPKNQIFVIMKFGSDELDSAYEGVIKPLGVEYGLDVIRVDEIQDSGQVSQQILESIASSRIVVAELTGERPNCYYEAGFAHALGKELIFVIHEDSKVHFDLAGYRFIRWKTESQLRTRLRERLAATVEKGSN